MDAVEKIKINEKNEQMIISNELNAAIIFSVYWEGKSTNIRSSLTADPHRNQRR